jgi:hypothetical protein
MMRFAAPVQGYDWLDPDPAGGLPAPPPFRAPIVVDERDVEWEEARRAGALDIASAFDVPPDLVNIDGGGTYGNLAGAIDEQAREIVTAGPGDPVYDYLNGTRDALPPGWPDEPTDGQLYAHAEQAAGPANLDEMRTAEARAADELAVGFHARPGNGVLSAAEVAERAELVAGPDWATEVDRSPGGAKWWPSDDVRELPIMVQATDDAIAAGASAPWGPGEREALIAKADQMYGPFAALEVVRFEPVVFAAPVIIDKDGAPLTRTAARKRQNLIDAVREYAARDPRSQQAEIGPSEIGDPCDARIMRKVLGLPVIAWPDPWASFVGTAVHAKLAEVFEAVNATLATPRYLLERRVWATPKLGGSTDLAEVIEWREATTDNPAGGVVDVYDHKVLGTDSMRAVKAEKLAPNTKYGTQIDTYALGWRNAGYEVRTVNLALWPRTGFLDGLVLIDREPDYGSAEVAIERVDWLRTQGETFGAATDDAPWQDGRIAAAPGKGCGFCPYYSPTLPLSAGSCDKGREFMSGAKKGTGPRGGTP